MTTSPAVLLEADARAVLATVLRWLHGSDAQLERWTAEPLMRHGKHRLMRYDLEARLPGVPQARRYQWVGKFYDCDADARRVATVLEQLHATRCGERGGMTIPRLIAQAALRRLLLVTYEPGASLTSAIARNGESVLPAIGRALAALHATPPPVTLDAIASPASVLADLAGRIAELRTAFPDYVAFLEDTLLALERTAPTTPGPPVFLHGDFGPANLLWREGGLVVLDFDKCTRGDPALDLATLFTQLRRFAQRRPDKLREFPAVRGGLLAAYRRWAPPDPALAQRVAWYERCALVRKIHSLMCDRTRRPEAEAIRRRQADAIRLLEGFDGHAA